MNDELLTRSIEPALRGQTMVLKGTALVSAVFGLGILLVGIFVPAKAGDENGKIAAMVIGVLMMAAGVGLFRHFTAHFERTRAILYGKPEDIASMSILKIKRGVVEIWSVQVTDTKGKLVGVVVPSEEAGAALIRRIQSRRA